MKTRRMLSGLRKDVAALSLAGLLSSTVVGCNGRQTYPGDDRVMVHVSEGTLVMRAPSTVFESEVGYYTRGFDDDPDSVRIFRRGITCIPGDAMYDSLMTFYPKVLEKAEYWPGRF